MTVFGTFLLAFVRFHMRAGLSLQNEKKIRIIGRVSSAKKNHLPCYDFLKFFLTKKIYNKNNKKELYLIYEVLKKVSKKKTKKKTTIAFPKKEQKTHLNCKSYAYTVHALLCFSLVFLFFNLAMFFYFVFFYLIMLAVFFPVFG